MLLGLVGGKLHGHHKVGGVSSGGEGASAVARLVHRHRVGLLGRDVVSLHGLQPDLRSREWSTRDIVVYILTGMCDIVHVLTGANVTLCMSLWHTFVRGVRILLYVQSVLGKPVLHALQ